MLDYRFYAINGIFEGKTSECTDLTTPSASTTTSIEVIAGKVVKFLLTYQGSDAFEPDYGGTALHYKYIAESFIPKLRLELLDDIQRCTDYINQAEQSQSDYISDRLFKITLVKLEYNPTVSKTRLDVYLEIVTDTEKLAVVQITKDTDQ